MSQRLRLRAEAVEDVIDAFTWYESQRSGLGSQFRESLGAALDLIEQAPRAGPVVHRAVRRVLLRRFPYAVYYTLTAELIEVRAVLHMRRDASHWRDRE